jgi:hypothetical protein
MPRRLTKLIQWAKAPKSARKSFHHRYSAVEARRTELAARLAALGEGAKQYPAYRTALTLLNKTFRKERLALRASILQAAGWLIDVLEQMAMSL